MKLGYTIWVTGWLGLLISLAAIGFGIFNGNISFAGRGAIGLICSGWWLRTGAQKIKKAKLIELEKRVGLVN